MRIRKCFDPVDTVSHPASVLTIPDYRKKYDENGNSIYVKVGDINITDYVNSFSTYTSLQSMLERCKLMPVNEMVKAVNTEIPAVSVDMVGMPTDYTDAVVNTNELVKFRPDLASMVVNGVSMNDIVKNSLSKKIKNVEEALSDGSNESSDD